VTLPAGGEAVAAALPAVTSGTGAGSAARGGSAGTGTPQRPADAATGTARRGLVMPPWSEIADRVPLELDAAEAAQATTTAADVQRALGALPGPARRAVAEEMERKEGRIREMAQQAACTELSEPQRDAFRVLAAATPEVRAEGLRAFDAAAAAETGAAGSSRATVPPGAAGEGTAAPSPGDGPMGQPAATAHEAPPPFDAPVAPADTETTEEGGEA